MSLQNIQITSRDAAPAADSGCSCCNSGPADLNPLPQQRSATATEARYLVAGMTCGHCAGAVTRELSAIDGVSQVDIDLVAGGTSTVTVTSTKTLPLPAVAAAVADAGYSLVQYP